MFTLAHMGLCQMMQNWKLHNVEWHTTLEEKAGGLKHPLFYKGEIHKSAENRDILSLFCVFASRVASGGVTLFVDGAKNVNKVGGWITNSSYTTWIIMTKSCNGRASKIII